MSPPSSIFSASRWSLLGEIVSKLAQPVIYLILARILVPNDFGVVTAAAIIISFSQLFWEAGLSAALVQTQMNRVKASETVLSMNFLLGCIVYLIVFSMAHHISSFWNDPRLVEVVRLQGIQIVLMSLTASQLALMQGDLDFRRLFFVRIFSAVVPGFISIPLALEGYGYYAMVWGSLVGSFVQLIMATSLAKHRIKFSFDFIVMRQMIGFGFWAAAEAILIWGVAWMDSIIVGNHFGSKELGVYRTGNMFVATGFGLLMGPLAPVLFSGLSRMLNDRERFRRAVIRATKGFALVGLPVGVFLFFMGDHLGFVLLGAKWEGIGLVFGWLGLMHGVSWTVHGIGDGVRAMGRPDVSTKISIICFAYYLPLFLWAAAFGMDFFLKMRLVAALAAMPIYFYVAYRFLSLDIKTLFIELRPFVFSALGLAGYLYFLFKGSNSEMSFIGSVGLLCAAIVTGLALYVLLLQRHREFLFDNFRAFFRK